MRLLVSGSRYLLSEHRHTVKQAIDQWWEENGEPEEVTVVHGGARGADALADSIAKELGFAVEVHPAQWDVHGKAAGPIRNQEMVRSGADFYLAFPLANSLSAGTWNLIKQAKAAGIPGRIIKI